VIGNRGDDVGVADLRREQHERMPSSTTYAKLKAAAAAKLSDEFDEHLAALREQHRRRTTLIAILDRAGLRSRSGWLERVRPSVSRS
jgi:hypothetical protein